MSYGIKVSKPGFNVLTADPDDLSLDTTKDGSLKISATYELSCDTSGGAVTESTAHGLGFVPAFFAIVEAEALGNFIVPYSSPGIARLEVYVDSTNVYAYAADLGGGTHVFKVVIFNEQIA